MSASENLLKILEPYNPWWTDDNWDHKDPLIKSFESSILKREPRLFYHFRSHLTKEDCYGIATVRGPRRVGKSTLIKLLIRHLIKKRIDPRDIFYISLDYEVLSNISLFEILRAIAESSDKDKYVFLDEASMYPQWATALKNAYDSGLVERGKLKIIATGSHSMDLADAASKLRGRQGCLAEMFNVGGNLVHVPLRFPEVVEALYDEIDEYFADTGLRRTAERFNILKELASGDIPTVLRDLYSGYFQLLRKTFENFLIHGGYPRAVNEFYDAEYIDPEFYYDVAELLISDAKTAGLDIENLKRVLEFLLNPMRLSGPLSLDKAPIIGRNSEGRPKGKFSLRDYLDYLRNTWTFFFSYPENGDCLPNYQEGPKIYVLDPFIYHALNAYLKNIPDPFEYSRRVAKKAEFRGLIVESVIASHLLLSQQLFERVPGVEYAKVLMYRKASKDREEIDFILCLTKTDRNYKFKIESKYSKSPQVSAEPGKIILTYDKLKAESNMVYVPVSLFLLLF